MVRTRYQSLDKAKSSTALSVCVIKARPTASTSLFLQREDVRTTWLELNLSWGCGWYKLVLGPSGWDEKGQRAHNTIGQEHPKLALSVPGAKPHARGETMVPSERPQVFKIILQWGPLDSKLLLSLACHPCRAFKEGASKAARLLRAPLFPLPLMLHKH